ncbi:3-hydroxyacyl-CoA dehydrogenase NAD-binding domain-containing protein [Luteithermobacter gelatinilyticus]|uniref:3-hydroxyacyl-CoA dehydrogenase NAD-binding domain-containing protein n=1 Tax=Luteithermobacter gelatinilyticus TaxID=2582913 RepID=UPI001106A0FF|nr:3-hydroxyacyl-CoA dehydrogenase NAD-binding domain-containing protein [Luteithermobacter gelatinilyticus]|tara:strand:+ start:766 stop:2919 length:2154 start_codon:yes stop_codon:yes gene_type:complete
MTNTIKFDLDQDGIALLSIDVPGKSMNVITEAFMDDMEALIRKISEDDAIKGAVITSAKEGSFVAGADLGMLLSLTQNRDSMSPEEMFAKAFRLNKMLRDLETCGKPVAAAVNGLAMGGGLEIVLACHHRVVADNPKLNLGLPEVMVGLLPGGGGTQRLPRLMGVQMALQYLLQGKNMKPQQALAFGVIQQVVPEAEIIPAAKKWILDGGKAEQPWDSKKFKIPGGQGVYDPNIVQTFIGATAMTKKETKGNYPAAINILSCVYEGHQLPMDKALAVESKYFVDLLRGDVAPNMIRTLFVNKQAAEKGIRRPKDQPKMPTRKLGMLGAGMMGAGIAYVSARAGIEVILLDVTQEAAEKGKDYSRGLLDKAVKRKKMSPEKADEILARIKPTTDYADLEGCDLIIEAVLEDMDVKADVTAKTEAVVPESCIYGSNTSTLPITELAKASQREDQFIGIHFFSPVDKMPLVEIIMGKKTGDAALAKALDYVAQIKKTPIVVNDSRGFYTSRCFATYVQEAGNMVAEGIAPALIENCGVYAGMAVGPLAVGDEVSLELSYHVTEATKKALGEAYVAQPADAVVEKLYKELGRKGKKNGHGFYEYPEGGKKYLWPGLAELFPLKDQQPAPEEVTKRLMYRQAIEVIRCLEEGVLLAPEDADIGAIFGWGFAPWTGGPLSMVDTIGPKKFLEDCEALAARYGAHYTPPKLLKEKVAKGEKFYS